MRWLVHSVEAASVCVVFGLILTWPYVLPIEWVEIKGVIEFSALWGLGRWALDLAIFRFRGRPMAYPSVYYPRRKAYDSAY